MKQHHGTAVVSEKNTVPTLARAPGQARAVKKRNRWIKNETFTQTSKHPVDIKQLHWRQPVVTGDPNGGKKNQCGNHCFALRRSDYANAFTVLFYENAPRSKAVIQTVNAGFLKSFLTFWSYPHYLNSSWTAEESRSHNSREWLQSTQVYFELVNRDQLCLTICDSWPDRTEDFPFCSAEIHLKSLITQTCIKPNGFTNKAFRFAN